MPPKFVPRQRKRRVLDRQRAANRKRKTTDDDDQSDEEADSNAIEITPAQQAESAKKREALRQELRPDGVKVSGKKAKRLEKYIETKLKKDENRELLARLAANKIDTSLFSSSRSLGQTKETKKQALLRALREENAGLKGSAALLYERREVADGPLPGPKKPESSDEEPDLKSLQINPKPAETAPSEQPAIPQPAVGSGLKRPLEVDETGRPVLAKRQKRGGVKTKHPPVLPVQRYEPKEVDWDGFSSEEMATDEDDDEDEEASDESDDEDSGSESADGESGSENGTEGSEEGSGEDSDASDASEDLDEEQREKRRARSAAFKDWAHQQRNQALGYESISTGVGLDIPVPANFKPRPLEQDPLPEELQPTTNVTRKAHAVIVTRNEAIQEVRYRLPVVAEEQKIMEAIHNNDVVVICGATGSGKTTQVPQFLFEAGYGDRNGPTPGMIGVTQPRRVAAVSMSKRVGQEMGDYSHTVAYQIRFDSNVDPKTATKFMTDGVLLREAAQDFILKKYSAIIIDEAHERSVNTDILIAILSRVVKLRAKLANDPTQDPPVKPLKLVIMSATLRIEDLTQNQRLFSTPPRVIEVEGREHAVTNHFSRKTNHDYVEEAFRKISRGHRKLPPGGMLVFLTGQAEIVQLTKRLKSAFGGLQGTAQPKVRISAGEAPMEVEDIDFGDVDDRNVVDDHDDFDIMMDDEEEDKEFELEDEEVGTGPLRMHILPLYSLLPTKEQMKVFEPPPEGSRLVILATNVAETSLTIPGIRYVFDSGRSKERRFDPVTGVQSFEIGWISKASAKQRAGRAGRTGPGHCWKLYSSAVYERDFPEFSEPEILRMPLEGVVLQLKSMNLHNVVNFPFPTPPKQDALVKAEKILSYLTAINPSGQITQCGSSMSFFPLAPRFAKILLIGHLHDCLPYTIAMVAGLSAQEVFLSEAQVIPKPPTEESEGGEEGEEGVARYRTTEDVLAAERRAKLQKAYNKAHHNFCHLDDKSDAIKLLQVVGEFAHEPTEAWCESRFVRYKTLKEIKQLQGQIADIMRTNFPAFASLQLADKLDAPSPAQVQALKQMVAAGFLDQVAIRADKAPSPPEMYRKPRRAIDVPYVPLIPLEEGQSLDAADQLVYLHPASPMAHLSVAECPQYVVYSHLQRAGNTGAQDEKRPKTRMHALTDLTGGQLAALAKGTPLIGYGKPIKELKVSADGKTRDVWVIPYLRAEKGGGLGWPLPARKITQKRVAGKGWVVE